MKWTTVISCLKRLFRRNPNNGFSPFLKCAALVIAILFSWDTVAWSAPAGLSATLFETPAQRINAIRSFIHNFSVPEAAGRIQSRYMPDNVSENSPIIVHIQDAHSQPETQRNIQAILSELARNKKIQNIAVEGAVGKVDPTMLRLFPDNDVNVAMAEHLVDRGEITGVELFALKQNKQSMQIDGIENPELYTKSFEIFQKTKAQKKTYEAGIDLL